MRASFILGCTPIVLALACGAPPTPAVTPAEVAVATSRATPVRAEVVVPPGHVLFEHHTPKVGEELHAETFAESRFDEMQGEHAGSSYHSLYTATILEASRDAVTRVRVTFGENTRRVLGAAEFNENATPLRGRTLILETAPEPRVLDEAGARVPRDVETLALDIFSDLGMRGGVSASLPDAPLGVGARVDPFAQAVVRTLNAKTWTVTRGEARIERVLPEAAEISLAIAATSESGLAMTWTGKAVVGTRTRRLDALMLDGAFTTPPPDRARGRVRVARLVWVGARPDVNLGVTDPRHVEPRGSPSAPSPPPPAPGSPRP